MIADREDVRAIDGAEVVEYRPARMFRKWPGFILASFNGGCGGMELHNLGYWDKPITDEIVKSLLEEEILLTGNYAPLYAENYMDSPTMLLKEWLNHPLRTLTTASSGDTANGPFLPDLMKKLGFEVINVAPNPFISHPFKTILTFWFLPPASPPDNLKTQIERMRKGREKKGGYYGQ